MLGIPGPSLPSPLPSLERLLADTCNPSRVCNPRDQFEASLDFINNLSLGLLVGKSSCIPTRVQIPDKLSPLES